MELKPVRTSYSQNSTYKECSKHWELKYKEKLSSETEGASTYFGSAIDLAVTAMLKNEPNWAQLFEDRWFSNGEPAPKYFQIFDNPNIVFGNNDFDEYVLVNSDLLQLQKWATELGLHCPNHTKAVDLYDQIKKDKKNPYKKITAKQLQYFNRASWLSLKRKGEVLLVAFKEQFLPKVKRVIDTQKYAIVEDSGDKIVGVIDMVVEYEGYDKPIIFDLKTSGQPYTQEQIELSDQLTLYAAMKGQEYNTNLVGYAVLCKNIPKETISICNTCGHTKDGRHQTCNSNNAAGSRCGGQWTETRTLKPEVQVMVQEKTPEQINDVMVDNANIIHAMKHNIVYRNTSKCNNWYGSKCIFFNKCHGTGDNTGLIKKER